MSGFDRPAPGEHAAYYGQYVADVPDGNILETLRDQLEDTISLLNGLPAERETFRYAEDKWSLREVVGHLVDIERMFAYRALAIAREDGVDLPGVDQVAWTENSNAAERPLADLVEEWKAVRRATVHLFASMRPSDGDRVGRASGYDFTVRSFAWIIAGHELWHRRLIERDYLEG